jgi:hypothetical protein
LGLLVAPRAAQVRLAVVTVNSRIVETLTLISLAPN